MSADDFRDAELWHRRGGEPVADGSWGVLRGVDMFVPIACGVDEEDSSAPRDRAGSSISNAGMLPP